MDALHKGDRVRVSKFGLRMTGRIGVIHDQRGDGKLHVVFDDGASDSFDPSALEKIPSSLGKID